MVIEFNHQLFLTSNLFYGFCKNRDLHDVFLFVCVQDISKKLEMDSDEILWTGWVCDKDELIRFW